MNDFYVIIYWGDNMKVKFSDRLEQALRDHDMKPADLVRACENNIFNAVITMKDIYKYRNGMAVPTPERLQVIADALNVSELWLLGYEVNEGLTREELRLVSAWRLATDDERENVAFILRNRGMTLDARESTKHA